MPHTKKSKIKIFAKHALIATFLSILLGSFTDNIILFYIFYYAIYRVFKHYKDKKDFKVHERIETLKDQIYQVDIQYKRLNQLIKDDNIKQFSTLAKQVLNTISDIQLELKNLKNFIEPTTYKRVHYKAIEIETFISTELQNLNLTLPSELGDYRIDIHNIEQVAPEIKDTYNNILRDHEDILKKIEHTDNKAELEAIHASNMQRFQDILEGYLAIKRAPKNYYNAQERLEKAKLALEKFDSDLDEMLRKLNESNLKDFDVSLRIMNNEL